MKVLLLGAKSATRPWCVMRWSDVEKRDEEEGGGDCNNSSMGAPTFYYKLLLLQSRAETN